MSNQERRMSPPSTSDSFRQLPRQPEGRESGQVYHPPATSVEMTRRLDEMHYPDDAMDLIRGLTSRFMEADLARQYLTTKDYRIATSAFLRKTGVSGRSLIFAMKYLKVCARDSVRPR